jgi:hypothetical protein
VVRCGRCPQLGADGLRLSGDSTVVGLRADHTPIAPPKRDRTDQNRRNDRGGWRACPHAMTMARDQLTFRFGPICARIPHCARIQRPKSLSLPYRSAQVLATTWPDSINFFHARNPSLRRLDQRSMSVLRPCVHRVYSSFPVQRE